MDLTVHCKALSKGDPTDAGGLLSLAWQELPELQRRPLDQFLKDSMRYIADDRWEIGVYANGTPVAGVICVRNLDPHVGDSLLVLYHYVASAFRGAAVVKALMRACKVLCRAQALPILAFTHRLSAREYRITYYEV